jgi:hypothetical protein
VHYSANDVAGREELAAVILLLPQGWQEPSNGSSLF